METWTWVLIYGGLILAAVGVFVLRLNPAQGAPMAWTLMILGGVLVGVGVLLIVRRSRLPP